MSIKPILFNTEMVRAILDGRKTVTRRLIKPRYRDDEGGFQVITRKNGEFVRVEKVDENECGIFADGTERHVNPKYQIDDILWVRETWLMADGCAGERYFYKADETEISKEARLSYGYKWHPSLHMPKTAARIFLKVKDVRVERLKDITEEQAEKEGFCDNRSMIHSPENEYSNIHSARDHFLATMLKIYPDVTMDSWVWVYEFERCEKPEGWCI